MPLGEAPGLVVGAVALGVAHGVEPGHGWPVAATYALDKSAKWAYGFAASFILGVGHLVSSIAMVAAFYLAKSYFGLAQVNEPISLGAGVTIGGPVDLVAGVLLIALGVREYRHGHSHSHGGGHDHSHSHGGGHDHSHGSDGHSHDHGDGHGHDHADDSHDHSNHSHDTGNPVVDLADDHSHDAADHSHSQDHADDDHSHGHTHADHSHGHGHDHAAHDHSHDHAEDGWLARLKTAIPFVGGHAHGSMEEATDRGLWGIAGFAFVLGFAHEEEFEIIAICAGSQYCLELMLIYALTVIGGIVALTLLLVAGYTHYEERVSAYAEYLPTFSAAVLVLMGLGFVSGLF